MFTAPTALRAIKKDDPDGLFIKKDGIGKLEALFVAGERCDPSTVEWATEVLKIPVIDHYWQVWNCRHNRYRWVHFTHALPTAD
jgi:acyl-coenzyme A synthetase/AMP-(fatty) acid ligase